MNVGARMKAAGLLALVVLTAPELRAQDAVREDRPPAPSAESWRRLRIGMSQLEVLRILGDPGRITRYYAFTRWEYPDALGRRVNFDERGRLIAWGRLAR